MKLFLNINDVDIDILVDIVPLFEPKALFPSFFCESEFLSCIRFSSFLYSDLCISLGFFLMFVLCFEVFIKFTRSIIKYYDFLQLDYNFHRSSLYSNSSHFSFFSLTIMSVIISAHPQVRLRICSQ